MEDMLCDQFLKNKVFIILIVVVVCTMYILLKILIYFCLQCFQIKPDFYFDGLLWIPLHSVCIWYDASFTQMNCEMLMKWLSEQFLEMLFVCLSSLRRQTLKSPRASRALQCVCCVVKESARSLPFIHTEIWSHNMS